VALVAVVVAVVLAPAYARAATSWKIAPAPGWVVAAAPASPDRKSVDPSLFEYLLDDTQVRVSEKTVERYRHLRYRPRSAAQVENGSQLAFEFNPAYERLLIHQVRIERAGRSTNGLAAQDVKVVQREQGLEERIYNGTLSALIFLRDIRINDVVDYAYTVEGGRPVLGGKYVARFHLADDTFTDDERLRLVLPASRPLTVKAHATDVSPTVTTSGNWRDYRWQLASVAPVEFDDGVPRWFDPEASIEVSEFASWAEVAALLEPVYFERRRPSPQLAAEIARLRAARGSDEDRLLEATRFVQDDIRYLGVEVGLGGAKPFDPSEVLERRFGDCKDKSVLLVTLLRELGLQAKPALVNTGRGRGLDDALPSPLAFDHAIVQVTLGGQVHFIDPTVSYQRGRLSDREPPDLERALLVGPDTRGLVTMPRPRLSEPDHVERDLVTLDRDGRAATLDVETTLRFGAADYMRGKLATRTRQDIGREYLAYYAQGDSTVTQAADLEAKDDEGRNVITVREHYRIGEFWRDGKRQLDASAIDRLLTTPRAAQRRTPYALKYPVSVVEETIVRLPAPLALDPESSDIGDDHLRFRYDAHSTGRELSIRYGLEVFDDSVAPEKMARYLQVVADIRRRAGYVLHRDDVLHDDVSWFKTGGGVVSLVLMGAGFLVGLVLGTRATWRATRRRRFKSRRQFARGESAATAIGAASVADIEARIARLVCACGGTYQPAAPEQDQHVRYDGRSMVLRSVECRDCRRPKSLFFAVADQ